MIDLHLIVLMATAFTVPSEVTKSPLWTTPNAPMHKGG